MSRCLIAVYFLTAAARLFAQSPAGYADPAVCAGCHSNIASRYARTGMARTFGAVKPGVDPALTRGATFRHAASGQTISVSASSMERHETAPGGAITNSLRSSIDYWFGSGLHARSYISRTKQNELIELPLTRYSERGGYWAMSPGYESASHAGFTRKLTYRCMFCHNAYPEVPAALARMDNGTKFPTSLPQGIDCQRCHGPGLAHARTGDKALIVNPATLPSQRRDEVCLQCHLEPTSLTLPAYLPVAGRDIFSYIPGQPLSEYIRYFDHAQGTGHDDKFEFASAPYRLRQSPCFLASKGALTCITCHDPHEPEKTKSVARANTACMNCHRGNNAPHTTTGNCVSCHMAERRPTDAIHVTITDHYIRRKPDRAATLPTESNSANTPPYRGEVIPYYPVVNDLYTAIAQVTDRANLQAGIPRLERAIADAKPAAPEPWVDLADAHRHAGNSAAALPYYREAIARDAQYWPAWHGLGLATAATGAVEESLVPLRRALDISAKDPSVIRTLAAVLTNLKRQNEAIAALRDGIAAQPDSAELHADLGSALLRAGDSAGAEQFLRESVRLKPESAVTRYNLAVVLEFLKRLPAAESELLAAVRIDPAYHAAHLKLGEVLIAGNKRAAAIPHLRQAAASPDKNIAQLAAAALTRITPGRIPQ